MILNYIFIGFFVIAFVVALIRLLGYLFRDFLAETTGIIFDQADKYVFVDIVKATFDSAFGSIEIILYLIGVMTLWLGILRVGERAGMIERLARFIEPVLVKLFPGVPKGHPAHGSIVMNFAANMLGLDNSATPLGIKAMQQLQEVNPNKEEASNAQIMFLVLNTSGLTLIPISVLALRFAEKASNPADVFVPILLATFFATLGGLLFTTLRQRINLLDPILLLTLVGTTGAVAGFIAWITTLEKDTVQSIASVGGNGLLFSIIVLFFAQAFRKKVNVYEAFIEGAKEGFQVAITIIPYLVGMLVAIGVFRASGTLDMITDGIGWFMGWLGLNTDFVPALPTAFMKPLSGSGARTMMIETMKNYGADSFPGFLSSVFQGSTETTFYTLAVYYGAVNIKKTRYTVTAGLFADAIGILAAIFIAYLFYQA